MNQHEAIGPILAVSGNYAVIQIPSRNSPAVAIQGDSLKILQETVKELTDYLAAGDLEEARFPLNEITDTISEMISTYEDAARELGFKLPYHP
ncbi:DUF6959 family protein [Streptomyces sp. NPDC127106]|uniref:DUF6959 family protein n=1 Tax=Streptomyces sp. NPDC127106 TaxID=3345360 RepID=UPI0036364953